MKAKHENESKSDLFSSTEFNQRKLKSFFLFLKINFMWSKVVFSIILEKRDCFFGSNLRL